MGVHDTLLHDMRLIWDGEASEVTNTWKNNRSPNHNYAKIGGSGSRNIAWMANAIGCFFEDDASAEWVRDAAKRECEWLTTETHKFRFSCFELNSLNYEGWNWAAEVSAMTWLREWKDNCPPEIVAIADNWVTRLLAHRTIMWAVQSRSTIQAHRDNGKLYWQGPGGYPGGLRSHPMQFWQGNQCGVDAIGLDPSVDKINKEEDLPAIIEACSDWGNGDRISIGCQRLIEGNLSPTTLEVVGPYLVNTRTSVPWLIQRFGQSIMSVARSHIEGGNTGAVWGTLVTGPDNWVFSYPYSSDRIRSGNPELGRGEAGFSTGTTLYTARNLTEQEVANGKGPRLEDSFNLPVGQPDLELRLNVNEESELYINGERWGA